MLPTVSQKSLPLVLNNPISECTETNIFYLLEAHASEQVQSEDEPCSSQFQQTVTVRLRYICSVIKIFDFQQHSLQRKDFFSLLLLLDETVKMSMIIARLYIQLKQL